MAAEAAEGPGRVLVDARTALTDWRARVCRQEPRFRRLCRLGHEHSRRASVTPRRANPACDRSPRSTTTARRRPDDGVECRGKVAAGGRVHPDDGTPRRPLHPPGRRARRPGTGHLCRGTQRSVSHPHREPHRLRQRSGFPSAAAQGPHPKGSRNLGGNFRRQSPFYEHTFARREPRSRLHRPSHRSANCDCG